MGQHIIIVRHRRMREEILHYKFVPMTNHKISSGVNLILIRCRMDVITPSFLCSAVYMCVVCHVLEPFYDVWGIGKKRYSIFLKSKSIRVVINLLHLVFLFEGRKRYQLHSVVTSSEEINSKK